MSVNIFTPQECEGCGGELSAEQLLLCDVVDGTVVGTVAVVTIYNSDGVRVAGPIAVDAVTGAIYVVQGELVACTSTAEVTIPQPLDVNVLTLPEVEVKNDAGNPLSVDVLTLPEVEVKNDAGNPLGVDDAGGSLTVDDSGEREYLHACQVVTAAGDTTIITPAPGNRIILHWTYAVAEPGGSNPVITVKLGADVKFIAYAVSKRQLCIGDIDAPLVVTLSTGGSVAFTALYEEV